MIKSRSSSHITVLALLLFVNSYFLLAIVATAVELRQNLTNNKVGGEGVYKGGILVRAYLSEDAEKSYVLGFAGPNLTSSFYLSIWMFLPSKQSVEVVWVANRDQFVKENATVRFVENGSLTLHDDDGKEVWSTNTDGRGALGVDLNTTSGNLRVFGASNTTLWQSFDHPTDTLLQGATLGAGSKLISNTGLYPFSKGKYSLSMEPGGMALRIASEDSESQPYWMWGYYGLNDSDSLSKTCQHPTILVFTQGVLSMDQDNNITSNRASPNFCNKIVDRPTVLTSTFLSDFPRFLKLDPDGNLRVYVYNGAINIDYDFIPFNKQCDLPERCGAYGVCNSATGECSGCPFVSDKSIINAEEIFSAESGRGCSVKGGTSFCNSTRQDEDTLLEITGINYYRNRYNPPELTSSSPVECKSLCQANCSCTASFFDSDNSSCYLVTDPIKTLQGINDRNLVGYIRVSAAAVVKGRSTKSTSPLVLSLGLTISAVFVVLLLIAGGVWRKRHQMRKSEDDAFLEALPGLPPRFTFKELQAATSGFNHKLGSGGFGTVYEGVLADGTRVAVKKLESAKQGRKEFRAEVATIGSIHHINLVRLRGFCADANENMLVYELMPNGALDSWLFHEFPNTSPQKLLTWSRRSKIALGTARGLAYLHDDLRERIIHLDIKPQNILLDEKFVPKVADFGLAKLLDRDHDQSLVVTTMRGTPGYLAPEWLVHSGITEKSDVYSYGMVLLELVTGRRNLDIKQMDPQRRYLPVWALRELEEGRALDIVDKRLAGDFDQEQALRAIHIAFLCIHEDMDMRPTMATVVQMLEGRAEIPERENLNVTYADVRHSLYSRFLDSVKTSATSPDHDNLEMTLLSNIVVSQGR